MNPDTLTFINAREAAGRLLDAIGLAAYLFEVEPQGNQWQFRVECATEEGWQTLVLEVDGAELLASRSDHAVFERLGRRLRSRVDACLRAP